MGARIKKYWFWDEGKERLPKERALECVVLGDTLNGDELIFHPGRPDRLFVLPHESENVFDAGREVLEAVEWICASGQLVEPFAERQFEPFDSRELGDSSGSEEGRTTDPEGESLDDLSERWYQAWLEKDATTVERLMAEDYLYVSPNGLALDRQAILAVIGSPSYRLDKGTRTEVVVRPLGHEAAIVRHRFQGAGSFEGSSFTDDNRCVLVWEKQGGEWRIVLDQCSFSSK